MANDDDEVAELYRVPLAEFTAARNALARKRGPAGVVIRQLQKPHVAAWAVNQLFWQRRSDYDAVIDAAQAVRQAHARMLSGRQADIAQAEAAHRDAINTGIGAVRELAGLAGESLSATTLDAVSETLQGLPSNEPPGQLTRPLKPLGFAALMALPGVLESRSPEVQGSRGPGIRKSRSPAVLAADRMAAKKEAVARAARRRALQKTLRAARARELEAEKALAASRKALAKVEREHSAAQDRLQFLEKRRDDAQQDTQHRARALRDATNHRIQADQDLDSIG